MTLFPSLGCYSITIFAARSKGDRSRSSSYTMYHFQSQISDVRPPDARPSHVRHSLNAGISRVCSAADHSTVIAKWLWKGSLMLTREVMRNICLFPWFSESRCGYQGLKLSSGVWVGMTQPACLSLCWLTVAGVASTVHCDGVTWLCTCVSVT